MDWIVPGGADVQLSLYIPIAVFAMLMTAVSKGGFGGGAGVVSTPLLMTQLPAGVAAGMWLPLLILCEEGFMGGTAFALLLFGAMWDAWFVVRMTRGDPKMDAVRVVAAGSLMAFLAWTAYSLGQPAMWVVNIYATVALVAATRRVADARLAELAAEQEPADGRSVPWLPHPAAAETEIAFS